MDDLSRIERIYGSVAEYRRAMEEREEEDSLIKETPQEMFQRIMSHEVYNKKVALLSGIPSPVAESLKSKWDSKAPKPRGRGVYTMADHYESCKYAREKVVDVVSKLCQLYDASSDMEWETFYRPPVGKFSISVEYHDPPYIKTTAIGNLNYEQFKAIFADLYYLGCSPTMCYMDENEKTTIISNSSLGSLVLLDLKQKGLETEATINEALSITGFNEKEFVSSKTWEVEGIVKAAYEDEIEFQF